MNDGPRLSILCPDVLEGVRVGLGALEERDEAEQSNEDSRDKYGDGTNRDLLPPCLLCSLVWPAN